MYLVNSAIKLVKTVTEFKLYFKDCIEKITSY